MNITPISGRQQLAFVGTLWEGGRDGWAVWEEFDRLREALRPVSRYIQPEFEGAAGDDRLSNPVPRSANRRQQPTSPMRTCSSAPRINA
jgi:hypothetical protein